MCGKLVRAMYGTRDAAQNWEYAYTEFMCKAGFKQGKANPCVFSHGDREVWVVVNGGDFTILGFEVDLAWFRERISEAFQVKFRGASG